MNARLVVGFTGTRLGLSRRQRDELDAVLGTLYLEGYREFRHGDCVGADEQASAIAHDLGYRVVVHPPTDIKLQAFTDAHSVETPRPYIERNRQIVRQSDAIIATPKTMSEERRSGTWATVRYARSLYVDPRIIIWPDGAITYETEEAGSCV
jgi:hypothetical protein